MRTLGHMLLAHKRKEEIVIELQISQITGFAEQ
jgi:hypothetical protein